MKRTVMRAEPVRYFLFDIIVFESIFGKSRAFSSVLFRVLYQESAAYPARAQFHRTTLDRALARTL